MTTLQETAQAYVKTAHTDARVEAIAANITDAEREVLKCFVETGSLYRGDDIPRNYNPWAVSDELVGLGLLTAIDVPTCALETLSSFTVVSRLGARVYAKLS